MCSAPPSHADAAALFRPWAEKRSRSRAAAAAATQHPLPAAPPARLDLRHHPTVGGASLASSLEMYAELSRAELARLGLVCEADAARLRARKQRPKKFRCPHCDVAFSNNGQLKGHVRIHTGERPFECAHAGCGKSFTRNEELTRHRRIHSGQRPFACAHCAKRFGRKDHLKKHTRTHLKALFAPAPPLLLPPPPPFFAHLAAAAAAAAAHASSSGQPFAFC